MRDVLTIMQRNKADHKNMKNNYRNNHQHLTQAEVCFKINLYFVSLQPQGNILYY